MVMWKSFLLTTVASFILTTQFIRLTLEVRTVTVNNLSHYQQMYWTTSLVKRHQQHRIFCIIFTHNITLEKKAFAVWDTWVKHCDKAVFVMSSRQFILETDLPILQVDVEESRRYLWNKTRRAFEWIYAEQLSKYDWFFKADDDTFAVMENMRQLVSHYDPEAALAFGALYGEPHRGYLSGGSGYVLSRGSVKILVEKGFSRLGGCSKRASGQEDVNIGFCLSKLDVTFIDTRDTIKRWRFFPYSLEKFLYSGFSSRSWLQRRSYFVVPQGMTCCSKTAVSFHYVQPKHQWLYYYFIYDLKVLSP